MQWLRLTYPDRRLACLLRDHLRGSITAEKTL
jgi:hypothetical protein